MRQTCKECRWYHYDGTSYQPHGCYLGGKWKKWIRKLSIDKPNDCANFEVSKEVVQ